MIPKRYEQWVFMLFLSCFMSLLVSGISTLRATGFVEGFFGIWMRAWLPSWGIAFIAVTFVVPPVRWIVRQLVAQD